MKAITLIITIGVLAWPLNIDRYFFIYRLIHRQKYINPYSDDDESVARLIGITIKSRCYKVAIIEPALLSLM